MFVKMWQSEHEIFLPSLLLLLLLLFPGFNLELKMHAILNFRSPERAVNKYEIKCLFKRGWRRRELNRGAHIIRLQSGGRLTGVASQHKSLHNDKHKEKCRFELRLTVESDVGLVEIGSSADGLDGFYPLFNHIASCSWNIMTFLLRIKLILTSQNRCQHFCGVFKLCRQNGNCLVSQHVCPCKHEAD